MAAISQTTFLSASFNENAKISIEISLKFVPEGPINNKPALVQIMAWRRPGDKPLSEPMMVCRQLGLDELMFYKVDTVTTGTKATFTYSIYVKLMYTTRDIKSLWPVKWYIVPPIYVSPIDQSLVLHAFTPGIMTNWSHDLHVEIQQTPS